MVGGLWADVDCTFFLSSQCQGFGDDKIIHGRSGRLQACAETKPLSQGDCFFGRRIRDQVLAKSSGGLKGYPFQCRTGGKPYTPCSSILRTAVRSSVCPLDANVIIQYASPEVTALVDSVLRQVWSQTLGILSPCIHSVFQPEAAVSAA